MEALTDYCRQPFPLYLARQCETTQPTNRTTYQPTNKNIMEIIVKATQLGQLQLRPMNDKLTGNPTTFKVLPFLLWYGQDSIYAEAVQDLAQILADFPVKGDALYLARLTFTTRQRATEQGDMRYYQDCRIVSLRPML